MMHVNEQPRDNIDPSFCIKHRMLGGDFKAGELQGVKQDSN
jgi:hypothetical protein